MTIHPGKNGMWQADMEHIGMHGERTHIRRFFFTEEQARRWEEAVHSPHEGAGNDEADFFQLYRDRLGADADPRNLEKLAYWEGKCRDYREGRITWKEFRAWAYLCDISNCEEGGYIKPEDTPWEDGFPPDGTQDLAHPVRELYEQ